MGFFITDFLRQKRDGFAHTPQDLQSFVDGFLSGDIPDYQVAAWLMAVYFRGLSAEETVAWTKVMWKSGASLPRNRVAGLDSPFAANDSFWIDKHSTGGVGDKTSMLLVPLVSGVAERLLGERQVRIPMLSGRGLGLTGGTLDKLDSVPGFRSRIPLNEASELLDTQGFFMAGQTEDLAPADRRIYALRDVTATVESVPLVVSSILSKKLAESLDGLVMDVKVGRGAMFQNPQQAQQLTQELLRVGTQLGLKMTAVLTRMDEPLGYSVGHALEMEECSDFLAGKRRHPALLEVTKKLALEMLRLSTNRYSESELEAEIDLELASHEPHRRFVQMLEAQGGDWNAFSKRSQKAHRKVICSAPQDGVIGSIDAHAMALLLRELGGSRLRKEDNPDLEVGIRIQCLAGDKVRRGQPIAELVVSVDTDAEAAESRFLKAVTWSTDGRETALAPGSWIHQTIRT